MSEPENIDTGAQQESKGEPSSKDHAQGKEKSEGTGDLKPSAPGETGTTPGTNWK